MARGRKPKPATGHNNRRRTTLTLTAEDPTSLAHLVAGGKVLLQRTHPVIARLKGAMTRMAVPIPQGL